MCSVAFCGLVYFVVYYFWFSVFCFFVFCFSVFFFFLNFLSCAKSRNTTTSPPTTSTKDYNKCNNKCNNNTNNNKATKSCNVVSKAFTNNLTTCNYNNNHKHTTVPHSQQQQSWQPWLTACCLKTCATANMTCVWRFFFRLLSAEITCPSNNNRTNTTPHQTTTARATAKKWVHT